MIIVKLMGGLGNQMFQYAAGRALALDRGVELKLDLGFLEADPGGRYTRRELELHHFNTNAGIASSEEVLRFKQKSAGRLYRVMQRYFPAIFSYCYLSESGTGYQSSFHKAPSFTYLDGFWQSELYFTSHADIIRKDFTLKAQLPPDRQAIENKIRSRNAVSIHIRRGDYVHLAEARDFHGVCDLAYYTDAIEEIKRRHGEISLFVFSDDPDWCRMNIRYPGIDTEYIDADVIPARDMWLMSRCAHHVIANSSFSWWGAWLNPSENKTVVAPRQWFSKINTPDIIPATWLRIG
jgi:hypothetical protein